MGPFGSRIKAENFVKSGVPVLKGGNLHSSYINDDECDYLTEEKADELKSSNAFEGDIVITHRGTIGQVSIIPEGAKYNRYVVSQSQLKVSLDKERVNPYYVNYFLRSHIGQHQLLSYASQVGVPAIAKASTSVRQIKVPCPPLTVQNEIVSFLQSLDHKITLNTQTNQTLEEMAQAIFKSWFVDFEPVKAKMNGEQPEGMDEATASLFPDKLDSETGIPEGWTQGSIADIAKLNAKSWTKKNSPEQVHYVDLANTKNGVIESVTTYDFKESPSRARRILSSGDTIVGTVRPGNRSFAFIGDTEQPLTGSTGFAVLSPKEECWTSFVYLATTNDDSIDEYARLADGGAYPAIKPVVVADTPCAIPTKDIAQKFWQLTGSMLKKTHQNRLENEELAKLRDTLLPKLLSGEIELDQIEDIAETVA